MDQTQKASRRASVGRSAKTRPWMTPSQLEAYLLARETLRRLNQAAAFSAQRLQGPNRAMEDPLKSFS